MKKKIFFFHILYYILFSLCYTGFVYVAVRLMKTDNLAAAVVRAGALLFVLTPAFILVLTRFSLLRWYVDPFAAAIVPMLFYAGMVVNEISLGLSAAEAFATVNGALFQEKGACLLLLGLFLLWLLATFSSARKAGTSISYRMIEKISGRNRGTDDEQTKKIG